MKTMIKNVEQKTVFSIAELVDYGEGAVESLTLAQEPGVGITVMAFDAGAGVSTHAAPGDAFVNVLEGEACITIAGESFTVSAGEGIVMPAGVPHAVQAEKRFKMLLTVVKE